jgi:serine/threonine-protein kinase
MSGGTSGVNLTGTGGAATSGGVASGGAVASGGNKATGGSASTATKATGATASTGGVVATGGATTNGGTASTGGSTGAGLPVGHCGAKKGRYFPATSWIYTDISTAPTRTNSAAMTAWLEDAGGWGNSNRFQIDTSFVILDADANTPRVAHDVNDIMEYSSDCDPNLQMPVPTNGRIEGYDDYICPGRVSGDPEGDCHMLVADFSSGMLSEAYQATYSSGSFYSTCTIAWNMTKDVWGAPPAAGSTLPAVSQRNWGIGRDCTGPDAAGFPIAPLLFTIGDVLSGRVEHAIRFALPNARMQRAAQRGDDEPIYVWPATHAGGPQAYDSDAPIYGSRWRLKANFDPAARGLDPNNALVKAVVYGLQHYGMLLADGGEIALMAEDSSDCGTAWDDLWGNDASRVLNGIRPSDFDVLDTGGTDGGWDCERNAR